MTGIVDVLAKNASDREKQRRFVFVKTKRGHLVANVRQYAIIRARMQTDYRKLQEIVECMNMGQKELLTTMARKEKLMSGALEKIREKHQEGFFVLEDRISAEELQLFEKREELEEIMKERRRTKVENWRVSDAARSGVVWKAASGAQCSRAGVGPCDEYGVGVNCAGSLAQRAGGRGLEEGSSDTERVC